ncbi:MAG: hypothetical protein ACYS8Z_05625 [Planctomycetota bacterium]|jgi:hypothetical protein
MRNQNLRIAVLCVLIVVASNVCIAKDSFTSPEQRKAFEKALANRDKAYDPAEKMISRPFSSPGYHTTLKGGTVHPTRDSLQYAIALLDSGQEKRLQRACDIIRRVIALQDQDPKSRTYGIWSWFLEEPLEEMAPPDWNWADFCGTQLLQAAIDHADRLPDDLRRDIEASIIHAANSIKRRNVGPGYTNIALMGTYVTLAAGDLYDNAELLEYGRARLRRFWDYTNEYGSFSEYNSPTYTAVAINEITRMLRHVKDPAARETIEKLNRFAWLHLARRFHPPTRRWSGPHSRCYATLLRSSSLAFIQRATGGKLDFVPESKAYESLDAHRLKAHCPEDFLHYFTDLPAPRMEIETFKKGGAAPHDIVGTTYLHPDFTLGSVNIGDLWNQRRPLLAYWKTDTGVAAMRLRCLHDDYDYSSASIFTVQDKANILGAVTFATDRGDTHISLDRLKNATITAKDLRLRLQLEGAIDGIRIAPTSSHYAPRSGGGIENTWGIGNQSYKITSQPIKIDFTVIKADFDKNPLIIETTQGPKAAYIDLILYRGPEKKINFAEIDDARIVFTLAITPKSEIARPAKPWSISKDQSEVTATWQNMSLILPTQPMRTRDQQKAASATLAGQNAWKSRSGK